MTYYSLHLWNYYVGLLKVKITLNMLWGTKCEPQSKTAVLNSLENIKLTEISCHINANKILTVL